MLTAESEGGQLKCHPYWKGKDFGPIRLRLLSEKKVSLDIDKHRADSATPAPDSQETSVNGASADTRQGTSSRQPSQAEVGRRRANTTTSVEPGGSSSTRTSEQGEIPYAIIRKFALSHTAHPFSPIREITQLHYPSWPDFGAPAQPSHLLALVELSNLMQRAALPVELPGAIGSLSASGGHPCRAGTKPTSASSHALPLGWHDAPVPKESSRPILVHCSAGCGRTGAFCTVDSVIDMLIRQRLRAAQRAHKRIDDQERRFAQQASERARVKRQALDRDVDGDVSMDEGTEPPAGLGGLMSATLSESCPRPTEGDRVSEDGDIDLSWLDDDTVDLVARTVEDFRSQRLSMVQSLRQFVLCYETILEWIWRLQERSGGGDVKGRGRSGSLVI